MSEFPPDAGARQRAIDAHGSVLVQAPAGSGKTTLLAQRYLRLLATVDAPERILALTFTRRAATEMRERVLQALGAAEAAECPPQLNPQTWELGRAARRRLQACGLDLARQPSRLRIETIDAFNAWLAGQLPIVAGAGARLTLTDAPRALYDEAARRTLAYDEPDLFGAAVESVLALDDQRWQRMVDVIARLLPSRERWLPLLAGRLQATALEPQQLELIRRHLDEDLRVLIGRTLAAAREAIGAPLLEDLCALVHAAARRIDTPTPPFAEWCANGARLTVEVDDLPRWRGCVALLLTAQGTYRRRLTKNEGFPPGCPDKQALLDVIEVLERNPRTARLLAEVATLPEPRYGDAAWARIREVSQVMVLAAAQLEQVFRERGLVDFPAVSLAAARALGSPAAPTDLFLRLDYRLHHLLIDEFQDTSSAQLELVKRLTAGWQRGDGRSVFCVGDPMQSIYGFRQAEVRAFLELAQEGVGEITFQVERLSTNFRSATPLVEWINHCFARILPRNDDRDRGAIAFRPSESGLRGVAADDAEIGLYGFASRRDEADAVAELISARQARNPEWHVAILVRARTHARDIAKSLRNRGIAFRAVDIEALQDKAVVRDLVALIRALLHLGDRSAWFAVLRAPWVGLDLRDLLLVARSSSVPWEVLRDPTRWEGMSDAGRLGCERLRATFELAFRDRGRVPLVRWVEQTWLALGGAACAGGADDLEHAAQVLDRLRDLERRGLPDAAELAQNFSDLYAGSGAAARVEIMTIHKAKGLEFDMVVVPALERRTTQSSDEFLTTVEFARTGRDGMVMAARPGVGEEPSELFDFLSGKLRAAAELEAERLLYVACTRAKRQLHLTALLDPSGAPPGGSPLAAIWPVVGTQFTMAPATGLETPPAPRGGPLRRVPADWQPASGEPFAALAEGMVASEFRVETPVFDWASETARRVGTLVHAELQTLRLDLHAPAEIESREPRYRRWLERHGVPPERLAAAAARVVTALTAVHADPRARWILDEGHTQAVREHALCGPWRGGIARVVFDRSFVAAGIRWVIDYKTSEHTGGHLNEFLDREVQRYRSQLERYAEFARRLGPEPVRVALYFPLMRAWREWAA